MSTVPSLVAPKALKNEDQIVAWCGQLLSIYSVHGIL